MGCKLTHSHQEQQRSVSDTASLSCTASWECSVPSDLATCLLRALSPAFVHPGAAPGPTVSAAFPGASLYVPIAQSVVVGPVGSTVTMAYCPVGPSVHLAQQCWWKEEGGYGGVPGLEWGLHWPHSSLPQNVLQCCSACSHAGASVPMTQREENSFMGCSDGGRAIW